MNDRIKLAEAMDIYPEQFSSFREYQVALADHKGSVYDILFNHLPNPFTDANDERAVFRHMMEQPFSVRRKYWRALRQIINERTDKLTKGGIEAAWPDAIMFLEDGDYARAALKVIE